MVYTAFILLVTITIPLWVGSFCMSGEEAKKVKDLEDCAHMFANATGCFPRPGYGSSSRPDGTVKFETEVIRECLPSAELGSSCTTDDCCVMNPALIHYRDSEEVRSPPLTFSVALPRTPSLSDSHPTMCSQVTCEFNMDIGEPIAFVPAAIFAVYYTWLLNSLVLEYQANGGAELKGRGGDSG